MEKGYFDLRTNLECRYELRKSDEQKVQIEEEFELFV